MKYLCIESTPLPEYIFASPSSFTVVAVLIIPKSKPLPAPLPLVLVFLLSCFVFGEIKDVSVCAGKFLPLILTEGVVPHDPVSEIEASSF